MTSQIINIAQKAHFTQINNLDLSFKRKKRMDLVFEKFDVLWNKSLVDPSDKNANSQFFQKARIDSGMFQDMVDLLKEEFYNSKHNIFEMHLYLIERSLNNKVISKMKKEKKLKQ